MPKEGVEPSIYFGGLSSARLPVAPLRQIWSTSPESNRPIVGCNHAPTSTRPDVLNAGRRIRTFNLRFLRPLRLPVAPYLQARCGREDLNLQQQRSQRRASAKLRHVRRMHRARLELAASGFGDLRSEFPTELPMQKLSNNVRITSDADGRIRTCNI